MKHLFFITCLLAAAMLSNSFAQDNTKVGLPEGAIARLGKGGINIMRFSPDGTRLAVGTDVAVWLYDVPDGKETALFTGYIGQVNALAFSADGKILASGGFANPVIQLWDLDTDSELSTLTLPKEILSISTLTFAKDNTILISLDQSGNISYWDVRSHEKVLDIVTEMSVHDAVAVSTDGSTFATGDKHGTIQLWDANAEHQLEDWNDNLEDQDILALAFSSDKKILASGSEDIMVRLWDTETRAKIATLEGHEVWVAALAFSPDGKTIATGDAGKVIKLWDVDTQRERATLTGHTNGISALTFTPDGKTLASGSYDGTIRFWNTDTGQEHFTFTAGHTQWIKAVAFAENGMALATAAFTGVVEVWNLKTAQAFATFTKAKNDLTGAVAFSHDATRFACRGGSGAISFDSLRSGYRAGGPGHGNIQLWDIITGEQIPGPWQDIEDDANALAFSPDNKILAANIPRQNNIRAWDITTGLELFPFNTAEPSGRVLVFSPNGTLLATNGTHVQTRVWDVTTQREITPHNVMNASALAFSPDGKTLAYGHPNGIVLSDITTTGIKERGRISNHRGFGSVLAFSPDGKILLDPKSIDWQPVIQLWDVDTGTDLGTLPGHAEDIEMLVFSHDGKTFASSSSRDSTVLLWDWDKISAKIATDNMGKEFQNNLEPPQVPIEYAGKAEEAEAVINYLKKHNYRVSKFGNQYTLTRNQYTLTHPSGSASGGGTIGSGNVTIKIDKAGILRIRVQGVGSATFTLDEEDNLLFHSLPDPD
ncbi:MAG: WD40 repeat domain-containing protein [Candidatus Poribacteria bacterium]|nr:WD40 repeat domain-containing protein [Candidatus Poribacteria bacterium]